MKCPHCKEPHLVISERKGIEIDYCPDCRGIWLNRGELDKILERARAEETAQAAPEPTPVRPAEPRYQEPRYQEPRYGDSHHGGYGQKPYYKRKKSFLEELFD